eukprot:CAMPEP_0197896014 /NCGR_PEP_ID=MMETSP1439-20131203/38770_1 /TAXON_ID=66791 /ORGANISM="Gonyaulax spinifera, Strain CCMP409" /LENGTH=228 /DNA_ID=CAMNT_0043516493 /DNA_START=8 /DNA_END=691 /DNA_ORIENTATION=+
MSSLLPTSATAHKAACRSGLEEDLAGLRSLPTEGADPRLLCTVVAEHVSAGHQSCDRLGLSAHPALRLQVATLGTRSSLQLRGPLRDGPAQLCYVSVGGKRPHVHKLHRLEAHFRETLMQDTLDVVQLGAKRLASVKAEHQRLGPCRVAEPNVKQVHAGVIVAIVCPGLALGPDLDEDVLHLCVPLCTRSLCCRERGVRRPARASTEAICKGRHAEAARRAAHWAKGR